MWNPISRLRHEIQQVMSNFDAGTNGWNAISEVDGDLAYRVNDEFLQQQIDSGKDIVLTYDPAADYKTYVESNGRKMVSYNKELNILKNTVTT